MDYVGEVGGVDEAGVENAVEVAVSANLEYRARNAFQARLQLMLPRRGSGLFFFFPRYF